jgi:hypothetical protein
MGKNGKKNQRKPQGGPTPTSKIIEIPLPEIPKMDEKKLSENEEE